jgi:hypothetical protein
MGAWRHRGGAVGSTEESDPVMLVVWEVRWSAFNFNTSIAPWNHGQVKPHRAETSPPFHSISKLVSTHIILRGWEERGAGSSLDPMRWRDHQQKGASRDQQRPTADPVASGVSTRRPPPSTIATRPTAPIFQEASATPDDRYVRPPAPPNHRLQVAPA